MQFLFFFLISTSHDFKIVVLQHTYFTEDRKPAVSSSASGFRELILSTHQN